MRAINFLKAQHTRVRNSGASVLFENSRQMGGSRINLTMNMSRNTNSIAIDRSAALNSASSFLHNKVRPSAGLGSTYSRYQANAMRQAANNNPAYGRALTANFDRSS